MTFRVSDCCLGKGAFGEVYMGLTEAGCPVAVKIVCVPGVDDPARQQQQQQQLLSPPKPMNNVAMRRAKRKGEPIAKSDDIRKDIEQVLKEVSVLSRLSHENIVGYISSAVIRLFDKEADRMRTKLAVIMEYIPGGSLNGLMTKMKGQLSEQTAVHYLRDILRGLQFLHEQHFIHRDLKPHNVLLLPDGSCKLTDFGTTVNIALLSGETDMMGTPVYMSPEACRNEKVLTPATDIWAFGIMMAEILTGSVPWPEEPGVPYQPVCFIYQIGNLTTMVPKLEPGSVAPEAERIIMACCQRDPTKRPTVSEILEMDYFRRVEARLPHRSRSPVMRTPRSQPSMRNPGALAGANLGGTIGNLASSLRMPSPRTPANATPVSPNMRREHLSSAVPTTARLEAADPHHPSSSSRVSSASDLGRSPGNAGVAGSHGGSGQQQQLESGGKHHHQLLPLPAVVGAGTPSTLSGRPASELSAAGGAGADWNRDGGTTPLIELVRSNLTSKHGSFVQSEDHDD